MPTQYYTPPTGNETAGFYELFGFINRTTSSIFFFTMLIAIWVISFLSMKQYSNSRAFFFASFFCAILSIVAAVLDYLAPRYMYLFIILTAIGLIWLKLDKD